MFQQAIISAFAQQQRVRSQHPVRRPYVRGIPLRSAAQAIGSRSSPSCPPRSRMTSSSPSQ